MTNAQRSPDLAISCSAIGAVCGISAVMTQPPAIRHVAAKWAAGFVLCHAAVLLLAAADKAAA